MMINDRFGGNGHSVAQEPTRPRASHKNGKDNAATLEHYAEQVLNKLNTEVITQGKDWWIWDKRGYWQHIPDIERMLLKQCLLIQSKPRDDRRSKHILEMIRQLQQTTEVEWRRAIGWKNHAVSIINVRNGVIRVNYEEDELQLIAADPRHWATAQLPVSYNPEARAPIFRRLLQSSLPDKADQRLLQVFAGYCLYPRHKFQKILFCYGPPSSGKSLLISHGLGSVFGEELVSNVSLEDLCAKRDGIRKVEGSLVNLGTEIDERALENSAIFNKLASGEAIDTDLKYEVARRIAANCKHINLGNWLPYWLRTGGGHVRRLAVIYFPNQFEPSHQDLETGIAAERDGIFNWMLHGLLKVHKLNDLPQGGEKSRTHYQHFTEQNAPLESFVKQCCCFDPEVRMFSKQLSKAFAAWQSEHHVKSGGSIVTWVQRIHGIKETPSQIDGQKGRVLYGVGLRR